MPSQLDEVREKYGFKTVNVATWRDPRLSTLSGGRGPRAGLKVAPEDVGKPFIPTYKVRYPVPEPTDDESSGDELKKRDIVEGPVESPLEAPVGDDEDLKPDETKLEPEHSEELTSNIEPEVPFDPEDETDKDRTEPIEPTESGIEQGGIQPVSDEPVNSEPKEDESMAGPESTANEEGATTVELGDGRGESLATDEAKQEPSASHDADCPTGEAIETLPGASTDEAVQADGDVSVEGEAVTEDKKVAFAPGTPEPKPTQRKKKGTKGSKTKKKRNAVPVSELPPDVQALIDDGFDGVPPPPPDRPVSGGNDAGEPEQSTQADNLPEENPSRDETLNEIPDTTEPTTISADSAGEESLKEDKPNSEDAVDAPKSDTIVDGDSAALSIVDDGSSGDAVDASTADPELAGDVSPEPETNPSEPAPALEEPTQDESSKMKGSKKSAKKKKGSKSKAKEPSPPPTTGLGIDLTEDTGPPAVEVDKSSDEPVQEVRELVEADLVYAEHTNEPAVGLNEIEEAPVLDETAAILEPSAEPTANADASEVLEGSNEREATETEPTTMSGDGYAEVGEEKEAPSRVDSGIAIDETEERSSTPELNEKTDGNDNDQTITSEDAIADGPNDESIEVVADDIIGAVEETTEPQVTNDESSQEVDGEEGIQAGVDVEQTDGGATTGTDVGSTDAGQSAQDSKDEIVIVADTQADGSGEAPQSEAADDVGVEGTREDGFSPDDGNIDPTSAQDALASDEAAIEKDASEAPGSNQLADQSSMDGGEAAETTMDEKGGDDTAISETPAGDVPNEDAAAFEEDKGGDDTNIPEEPTGDIAIENAGSIEEENIALDEQPVAPPSPVLSKTSSHGSHRSTHWDRPHQNNPLKNLLESPTALKRPHGHRTGSKDEVIHRSSRRHRSGTGSDEKDKERRERRKADKRREEAARALEEESKRAAEDERRRARQEAKRAARKTAEEEAACIAREEAMKAAEKDAEKRRRRRREKEEREIDRRQAELEAEKRERKAKEGSERRSTSKREDEHSSRASRISTSSTSRSTLAQMFSGKSYHGPGVIVAHVGGGGAADDDRPSSRHSKESTRSPKLERSKTSPASVAAAAPKSTSGRSQRSSRREREGDERDSRREGEDKRRSRRRPTMDEKPKSFLGGLLKRS